ncbi:hypothetical protein J6590_030625 [Homalodisca vitripennis]|nr:hypothetical protein J6590_030625 [Homalodisca vitripennis]
MGQESRGRGSTSHPRNIHLTHSVPFWKAQCSLKRRPSPPRNIRRPTGPRALTPWPICTDQGEMAESKARRTKTPTNLFLVEVENECLVHAKTRSVETSITEHYAAIRLLRTASVANEADDDGFMLLSSVGLRPRIASNSVRSTNSVDQQFNTKHIQAQLHDYPVSVLSSSIVVVSSLVLLQLIRFPHRSFSISRLTEVSNSDCSLHYKLIVGQPGDELGDDVIPSKIFVYAIKYRVNPTGLISWNQCC